MKFLDVVLVPRRSLAEYRGRATEVMWYGLGRSICSAEGTKGMKRFKYTVKLI